MNDETAPQQQQRAIALLGLAAQKTDLAGACPADETMAAFLDDRLSGKAREGMLAHLNRCPGCYHQWLEAATTSSINQRSRVGALSPSISITS